MKSSNKFFWWIIELDISSDLEETFYWKFSNLGIHAVASEFNPNDQSKVRFKAWLSSLEWDDKSLNDLYLSLIPLAEVFGLNIKSYKITKVDNKDWSALWKKHWKPDAVGINFLVLPAWLDIPKDYSNRVVLRLNPGSAFGTGSHPTTRLCLESIEKIPIYGKKIADLGCGSGILSLAALKKGAKKIFAVDTDSLAVKSTKDNAILNNIDAEKLQVSLGSIDTLEAQLEGQKVDLLLCNILADIIEQLAPKFDKLIAENGSALLSGLLLTQKKRLEEILKSLGWRVVNFYEKEGWVLINISRF